MTPEEQIKAHKLAKAILCKRYLYAFAKYALRYKDITHRTHGDMINCLEAPTERKLIVMPRGTFKSSLGVVAFPMWRLLQNPNERILIDSEVYSNSKNFLREIKAHYASDSFQELFGDWKGDNWTEGEITVNKRTKALKEASITAGGIGTVKVGQHYSIIIGDDMNSGNNSNSVENRKKVLTHYRMNMAILEPGGIYVVIGTRYAVDDVIGSILEQELGFQNVTEGVWLEAEPISKGLL